jgi:prevent-host-death family protein
LIPGAVFFNSLLVRLSRKEGPQVITRRGKEEVVVVPIEEYSQLVNRGHVSLVQFLAQSPLAGIDLERVHDYGRRIES